VNLIQVVFGALAIVAMFLILVVPHETGHFALAKLCGVKVHEYSLGIGAKLASVTRGGTLYALRAIPVLGYVRLGGMEPGEFEDPAGFHRQPAYQRLLILVAGPAANFVVAALLMTAVSLAGINGDPGKVGQVEVGSPAYQHGIRVGDSVQLVNGQRITSSQDILKQEQAHRGQPITLTVRRADGSTFTTTVQPRYDRQLQRYLIGIATQAVVTPGEAIVTGATFPLTATVVIGQATAQVFTGRINPLGPEGVTGVIGLGAVTYQTANTGGLINLAVLVAFLSMAIGLTNLLPIPALDGGRIVVVLFEKLRGRPFDRERELAVQRAALAALLALMVLIAFLDLQRLTNGQFVGLK
jgi:regulator of sigma E protease